MEDAYHNLTGMLFAQERWEDARELLRRGLAATDQPAARSRLNIDLGGVLWEEGRFPEAERAFSEAIAADPGNVDARLSLGGCLAASGDLNGAEAVLRDVANTEPPNSIAHCVLGATLVRQGRHEEALRWFQRALELDPDCLQGDPEWRSSYEIAAGARLS